MKLSFSFQNGKYVVAYKFYNNSTYYERVLSTRIDAEAFISHIIEECHL